MIDHKPRQMLFENQALDTSPKAFVILDTLPGEVSYSNFIAPDENLLINRLVSHQSQAHQRASALYRAARFAGQISRFLSWLTHHPDHLIDASEIVPNEITAHHYAGLQTVPINRIIASERRSHDFDSAFNPLRDENRTRWTDIATIKLLGADLPPVDLIQVQDAYIVSDGHHRISVACALGQESIDAHVTTLQCTAHGKP